MKSEKKEIVHGMIDVQIVRYKEDDPKKLQMHRASLPKKGSWGYPCKRGPC